ncbi:MAG TPA: helix-turn-helix domain-containing protein [Pirellulales bacterium]|jgi:transcriptional regulator with XRE-family HTH domain
MKRKTSHRESQNETPSIQGAQTLGKFLAYTRGIKKLTLRDVEEATEKEVSNAYLSQLENDKISRPSPNVLHALATVYGVEYDVLMAKAGYFSPTESNGVLRSASSSRHGRAATFANEHLSQDEEEKLLEYLAFLRSRRNRSEKTG